MNEVLVKAVRSATISACIERGITNPKTVRKVLRMASKSVKSMSVAGVQAAISKGQGIYVIDKQYGGCNNC